VGFQPLAIAEFHEFFDAMKPVLDPHQILIGEVNGQDRGFKEEFYYPVNEENTRCRKFAESMGGTGRVLAHCYDKRLAPASQ
jgi:hypothetical protein